MGDIDSAVDTENRHLSNTDVGLPTPNDSHDLEEAKRTSHGDEHHQENQDPQTSSPTLSHNTMSVPNLNETTTVSPPNDRQSHHQTVPVLSSNGGAKSEDSEKKDALSPTELSAEPLAKTRPEVFKSIKEYITRTGSTAGGAVAVEASIHEFNRIEPNSAFQVFCDVMSKVNKTLIGTPDDPTGSMIKVAVDQATDARFWATAADSANSECVTNLSNRCRNWISVKARQESFSETVIALELISRSPSTGDLLKQVNSPSVLTRSNSQTSDNYVHTAINKSVSKYPEAFATEVSSLPSKVTSMKLFGDDGASKSRSHKRQRPPSPPAEDSASSTAAPTSPPASSEYKPAQRTQSQSDLDSPMDVDGMNGATSTSTETEGENQPPPRKRTKKTKRVSWKRDEDLVQVKFFEMEGPVKFRSAKNAKQQEHEEGFAMHIPLVEWKVPEVIDFDKIFGKDRRMQELMATRRGGLKEPDSEEARIQEQRESRIPGGSFMATSAYSSTDPSPKEPPESETRPEPGQTPRQGGKFTPADPFPEWAEKNGRPNAVPSPTMNIPPITGTPAPIPNMAGIPGMPGSAGTAPMMPMPMPGFPWGFPMNMPMPMNMNMGIPMTPNQMPEVRDRQNKPFSRQS